MTSHHDSHTTTDVKPEMIPAVQTGNGIPHDKYNIRGIAHARTNRKDNIFMQRRLYIEEAHMGLDIFRFAVSFLSVLSYLRRRSDYCRRAAIFNKLQISWIYCQAY